MNLDELRAGIDVIDEQITDLFEKRMSLVSKVADYKRENNLPVLNTSRERDIISRLTKHQTDEMAGYTKTLFMTLFDVSRSYQNREVYLKTQLAADISAALSDAPVLFPKSALVACQGIEGSNSQLACEKLFARPDIMYFNSFVGVFTAVDKGLCKYGILPIENSLQGSVTEVYDLMMKYKLHISRAVKLKINHTLLAKPGVKLEDVKEVYSHEQALAQCADFLKGLKNVKLTPCENTAIAAKNVSESERNDIAAISTQGCGELYGLDIISGDIQNNGNNYTRFICISKMIEIYPGANKISLLFTVPHTPGALYRIMSKYAALGVNLTKLESRPIPERDFEFMFYVDLEASAYSNEILNLICDLESGPEFFAFLGNYSEV